MAHLITFTTSRFDVGAEPPNPVNPIAGHGVLAWVGEQLGTRGYQVTEPDYEDWGWYMLVDDAQEHYMVGASGDAEEQAADVEWIVQVNRERTLMDQIRGRNKLADDDRLFALIEELVRAQDDMADIQVDLNA